MKKIKNLDPLLLEQITDSLYKESKYISNLYHLVTKGIEPPFSIAIDGDWGTGKTTILKLLEKKLQQYNYPTFWFNAWEYSGSDNIMVMFLKNLAKEYHSLLGANWRNVGLFFKLLAVTSIDFVTRAITNNGLSLAMLNEHKKQIEKDKNEWKNIKDVIQEIKNEFIKLIKIILKKNKNNIFYVFIDDLDRCLPNDTIKILEAIKNIFIVKNDENEKANVIFICGINSEVAQNFIRKHYYLENKDNDYPLNYFRKIFNLTLSIPSRFKFKQYIEKLFDNLNTNYQLGDLQTYFKGSISTSDLSEIIWRISEIFKNNSMRKFQNIVNNYYILNKMFSKISLDEQVILIILLSIKAFDAALFSKLKNLYLKNNEMSLNDCFSIMISHFQKKEIYSENELREISNHPNLSFLRKTQKTGYYFLEKYNL